MNIVDYIAIGIIAISLIFGFYRGFVASVLNTGGGLIAFGLSFVLYPKLAAAIQSNDGLVRTLLHYTDASSRIGDLELAISNVANLTGEKVAEIIQKVALPAPFDTLLQVNLEQQIYASTGISSVADYVSQTILTASINILCFLVCFVALYLVISIVVNLLRAVFKFPLLKQLDWLAGGVFGLLRGVLLCYAAFAVVPLVLTMVPIDFVSQLMAESTLAPIFNNGNLILSIMNGRL
ncbi:MAG: CvpA family protein [Clostridia bacterium]|nr:CvpA family protein [Clostridia bacterium]